ncbi:hypothetical protein [Absidia glauca]|uniref:GIT Spa2 homology (SHD) domain-containing protein n=1 Tax=Absidia glauca TaxID=4829 RepID=A0A163IR37_ABSGL|nr:hypothetical protein [Absidia glauca]
MPTTIDSPTLSSYSCHDTLSSSSSTRSSSTPPISRQQAREMSLGELSTTKLYRTELKVYLTQYLEKEASQGATIKRITSRRKLSKLNNGQFMELARDVYDEMTRRCEMKDPFLPVHDEFHPRRNQARQKLATLPDCRFMYLSSDVYHELSRRYPHTRMEKNDALPPLPAPIEYSTTITTATAATTNEWFPQTVIPEKGSIQIEDSDPASIHPLDYSDSPQESSSSSNWTDSLDSLIADIDSMVRPKSYLGNRSFSHSSTGTASTHTHSKHPSLTNDGDLLVLLELKQQIQHLEDSESSLQQKCDHLNQENQTLLHQHRQQEEVVQKVKREIAELLDQLDTLSSKNAALLADRDAAYERLDSMQDEINDWQAKHHQLLHQQQEEDQEQENVLDLGSSKTDGVISQETLVTYQTCVDALVKTSR